jgi:hypothetical protein
VKIRILITTLLFAITNAFAQVPSYVPTNGLVGWWPFNGNANDESGNGNNATFNSASLISNRFGIANSAYSFGGNGQYMLLNPIAALSGASELTVSAWVKISGQNTNTNCNLGCAQFLLARDPDYSSQGFSLGYGQGSFKFGGAISNSNGVISSQSFSAPFSSWQHIAWTVGGGSQKIFVNGLVSNSSIYNGVLPISNGNLYFGYNPVMGYPYFLNGLLDDIAIWNRALSASEIQQLYTTQAPCTLTSNFFATDTISACGNSVNLNAQNAGANYLWSNNATTQSITTNTTGWYKCTVSQGANCIVSDSVYVSLPNALPTSLQAGLVGYWPFCGNANDESGNGNNGTVNGATLTSDRFGNANKAYSFDGINDYINLSSNIGFLATKSVFTIQYWVMADSTISTPQTTFANWVDNTYPIGTPIGFYTGYAKGLNIFTAYIAGLGIGTIQNVSNANWNHVIIVFDGAQAQPENRQRVYVNGLLLSNNFNCPSCQNNIPQTIGSLSSYTTFGGRFVQSNVLGDLLKGKLDDICIWNRALTSTEVQQLFATQSANPTTNNTSGNNANPSNLPNGISYQAIARDSLGQPLANSNVEVRFTLRDSSVTGAVVYKETHALTTNQFGLFSTAIGSGNTQSGVYSNINWMGPAKFLDVELKQGANYVLLGSQQLLAVPYANAANSAGKIKNTQVPVYANNTAAIAGGLQAGEMYRTPTGALMIVY